MIFAVINETTKRAIKFERIAARPRNFLSRYVKRIHNTHEKRTCALLRIIEMTGDDIRARISLVKSSASSRADSTSDNTRTVSQRLATAL